MFLRVGEAKCVDVQWILYASYGCVRNKWLEETVIYGVADACYPLTQCVQPTCTFNNCQWTRPVLGCLKPSCLKRGLYCEL